MSELKYPWDKHPAPGTTMEVAPGVRWLTMPMGGSLNHINLYLLEDTNGWWVVDTGLVEDERTPPIVEREDLAAAARESGAVEAHARKVSAGAGAASGTPG